MLVDWRPIVRGTGVPVGGDEFSSGACSCFTLSPAPASSFDEPVPERKFPVRRQEKVLRNAQWCHRVEEFEGGLPVLITNRMVETKIIKEIN